MALEAHLVTTNADVPGHRVSRNLGVVHAHAVCALSSWGNLGAVVQSFVSGDLKVLQKRMSRAGVTLVGSPT